MLTRQGPYDEEALVNAAKHYLPHYGRKEESICEIPYREQETRQVRFIRFMWLAEQWVFVDVVDGPKKKPKRK
ncbi:MAG TPA: hypothetical protein VGM31_14295 [Puia sp.]